MQVRAVHASTATLKDATSEAIRDWVTNVETTHYILGSAAGPHPYPSMVRARSCATYQRAQQVRAALHYSNFSTEVVALCAAASARDSVH